jgi:hypothetical protein
MCYTAVQVMPLRSVTLDELTIEGESSFAHVAIYGQLKRALRRSAHRFLVPAERGQVSWDRALFLNLTYWDPEHGADVLCEERIPADIVAHIAWHGLVANQLGRDAAPGPLSPAALLFAESIASAFDMYLVGRLLRNAPDSDFIATQVSIMGEAAAEAGLAEADFATLLEEVCEQPERAFEDLRALLLDAATALFPCRGAAEAQQQLERFAGHRFEALLHHYQLSNWILYARAYARPAADQEQVIARLDAALRAEVSSLDWLTRHWIEPVA